MRPACAGRWTTSGKPHRFVRGLLKAERYDVIHFVFSLPTAAMLPLLDLHGAPVIVSLRGSDVPGFDAEMVGVQRAHRLLHPLTRWIWRRADASSCRRKAWAGLHAGPTRGSGTR